MKDNNIHCNNDKELVLEDSTVKKIIGNDEIENENNLIIPETNTQGFNSVSNHNTNSTMVGIDLNPEDKALRDISSSSSENFVGKSSETHVDANIHLNSSQNAIEADTHEEIAERATPRKSPSTEKISPKRTVSRRKAAENSQKKWKYALEEDQTYEALPKVFQGPKRRRSKTNSTSHKSVPSPHCPQTPENSNSDSPSSIKSSKKQNDNSYCKVPENPSPPRIENSAFTIINDEFLRRLLQKQRCLSCFTQNLYLDIVKNENGLTVELIVLCTKCKDVPHKIGISTELPDNFSSYYPPSAVSASSVIEKRSTDVKEERSDDKVELLVCDVDVLSENHLKPENDFNSSEHGELRSNSTSFRIRKRRRLRGRPKKPPQINPIRPCVFCSKMQVRLSRHIKFTHSDEPFVQNMLKQPVSIQAKMMRQLRSEGIFAENQRRLEEGRADLLMIRNQGSGELSPCNQCHGYYKKKLLWRHRLTCLGKSDESSMKRKSHLSTDIDTTESEVIDKAINGSTSELGVEEEKENSDDTCVKSNQSLVNSEVHNGGHEDTSPAIQKLVTDISRIHQIKALFDGIRHGIFSQTSDVSAFNGLLPGGRTSNSVPSGEVSKAGASPSKINNTDNEGNGSNMVEPSPTKSTTESINEDQLLFDSLPAILNSATGGGKQLSADASSDFYQWKSEENGDASSSDNSYYTWKDFSSMDIFQDDYYDFGNQGNRKRKARADFQYQFWTKEEEDTLMTYFTEHINALKVPGKDICREFLMKYPTIKTDWTRVKYKVYNQIQKKRKKLKKIKELN